uniref:Uncharacterized protein n=1 Tax=Anopheles coluzzii TaxID=1518534 RepID=A0A8W7PIT8_ANOCL
MENDSSMSQMANAFSSRLTPLRHVVEDVLYRQIVDAVRAAAEIEHDQVAELERHLRECRIAHVGQQAQVQLAHVAAIVCEQAAHQPGVGNALAIDVPQPHQTFDRRNAVVGNHPAPVEDERLELRNRARDLYQCVVVQRQRLGQIEMDEARLSTQQIDNARLVGGNLFAYHQRQAAQ